MNWLAAILRDPASAADLGNAQWEQLLGEARRARMLSRVSAVLQAQAPGVAVPAAAADILQGHALYVAHVQVLARQELRRLAAVAAAVDYPVVLLKGIAYLAAGLPVAPGRSLNDLDVLVPHAAIDDFEQRLKRAGWAFEAGLSSYDEHYYRHWSHELPPMRHPQSALELDVHHNLIQLTGRTRLDMAPVLASARPLPGTPFAVLAREDMVLHSALHLLMSDELRGGIRDLFDIHSLCCHFAGEDKAFWASLVGRAGVLGLQRPLYYALAACRELFGLQVPAAVWALVCGGRPGYLTDAAMRTLVRWHLAPEPAQPLRSAVAQQLLFLRSHWIRMPPLMLVRHLTFKGWLGLRRT